MQVLPDEGPLGRLQMGATHRGQQMVKANAASLLLGRALQEEVLLAKAAAGTMQQGLHRRFGDLHELGRWLRTKAPAAPAG